MSVLSLILGIHGERTSGGNAPFNGRDHVVAVGLTGLAGLLAGAASMASGEWCVAICAPQPLRSTRRVIFSPSAGGG